MTSKFYKNIRVHFPRQCSKLRPHSKFDWCLWLIDLFCEQGPIRILVSLINKPHHRWNLCSIPCPDQTYTQDFLILGSKRQNLNSKLYHPFSQHQKWCKILYLPITLSGLLINSYLPCKFLCLFYWHPKRISTSPVWNSLEVNKWRDWGVNIYAV